MTYCRHCLRDEDAHHAFEPLVMPDGCECIPSEWENPEAVPLACARFRKHQVSPLVCVVCSHAEECHG